MSMKNRVEKIQSQLVPKKFAEIEDVLRRIHLKEQKGLSEEDQRTLEELEPLPLHPRLVKALSDIERRKQGNEHDEANRSS